jgi:hypothetical protein
MNTCVAETIAAIDQRIITLQFTKENLLNLFSPVMEEVRVSVGVAAPVDRNGNGKAPAARPSKVKAAAKPMRKTHRADRAINGCWKCGEPFKAAHLMTHTGLSKGGATGQIARWILAGLVKKVSPGQYVRTGKFPAATAVATAAAPVVVVPGLDELKLSVEQRLEKALKDRDQALAQGQERLAKILQDKVDKLQGELEAK